MTQRIALQLWLAMVGLCWPLAVLHAQSALEPPVAEAPVFANHIEDLQVAEYGGTVYLRLQLQHPPAAVPASFSIASPARVVVDLPATGNALGRSVQRIDQGELASADIVQVEDRTRVVLNLVRMRPYEVRVEDRAVVIAVAAGAAPLATAPSVRTASTFAVAQAQPAAAVSVRDVQFRRGKDGEGRIEVDLSGTDAGIDIRRQGDSLVVDFADAALPEHLRRRADVSDFATPVMSMSTQQAGDRVRLTVTPHGQWEHNAFQADQRFVLEIKRITEDPARLVQGGRGQYQGEKLSLNFQNVDLRSVLQVIADFTDLNIITSDSVQGSLTLRLKDVPWDQALDIILQAKGLDMRKNGNVIWIAPGDELATRERLQLEARAQIGDLEPLQTESLQINYHKAREIFDFLKSRDQTMLSRRGSVVFDERSNKIFVTDVASRLQALRRLVQEIDVPPRQVLIEARIVEASNTFARDLGVRLGFGNTRPVRLNSGGAQIGFGSSTLGPAGGQNAFTPGEATSGAGFLPNGYGALNLTLFNSRLTRFLNLELQALESDGRGRVVSSPRVLTANQVEASIEQGKEVPYQEATSSGATSVSFKKAVLALKVKPQITPDGRLQLSIEVNKDRVLREEALFNVPPIETKNVRSEVLIDNGGTVVIGGIYEEEESTGVDQVPVLGDIPVLGNLFRTTTRTSNRRELLVFITPRIVSDALTLR